MIYSLLSSLSSGACVSQRLEYPALLGQAAGMVQRALAECFSLLSQPGHGGAEPVGICKHSSAVVVGPTHSFYPALFFQSLLVGKDTGRAACCCPPSWGGRGGLEPLQSVEASALRFSHSRFRFLHLLGL